MQPFNDFAKAVERVGEPEMIALVARARLFTFKATARDTVASFGEWRAAYEEMARQLQNEGITLQGEAVPHLPFDVVFFDVGGIGFLVEDRGESFRFLTFSRMSYPITGTMPELLTPKEAVHIHPTLYDFELHKNSYIVGAEVPSLSNKRRAWGLRGSKMIRSTRENPMEELVSDHVGNAAIGSIVHGINRTTGVLLRWLNMPTGFIVEVTESQPSSPPPNPILRLPWRPHYTVLRPREIRSVMRLVDPSGDPHSHVAPHERRGHFRVYKHERFKFVKGKPQWIPSTWIGPSEAVVGTAKYKVLLDK